MALTLPYPTIEQFSAVTVHSYSAHNSPHNKLLANDIAIKSAVDTLQSQFASIPSNRIVYLTGNYPPYVMYRARNKTTIWSIGVPAEHKIAGTENTAHKAAGSPTAPTVLSNTLPAEVPTSALSYFITISMMTWNSSQSYVRIAQGSAGETGYIRPSILAAFSWSANNSDDAASDVNTIELPYHSSRVFKIYWDAEGQYNFSIAVTAYREG